MLWFCVHATKTHGHMDGTRASYFGVQILVWRPTILTDTFKEFPQCHKANDGTAPKIRSQPVPSTYIPIQYFNTI
jgi:hypothetical protein